MAEDDEGPFTAHREMSGLLDIFNNIGARRLDLLHDMGTAEAFLICGESLLYDALKIRRVSANVPVSVVYVVESLLRKLTSCRGNFTVCFFESYLPVWNAYSSNAASAARQLLQCHLSMNGVPVVHFDSWEASTGVAPAYQSGSPPAQESFQQYLTATKPTFMLVTDAFVNGFMEEQVTRGSSCALPAMVLGMTLKCLHWGTDCAYMSHLEFDLVTVHGFLSSAEKSYRQIQKASDEVQELVQQLHSGLKHLPNPLGNAPAGVASGNGASWRDQLQRLVAEYGWRLGAGIWCCSQATMQIASSDAIPHLGFPTDHQQNIFMLKIAPASGCEPVGAAIPGALAAAAAAAAAPSTPTAQPGQATVATSRSSFDKNSWSWLVDAFLLHLACMNHLPLRLRALEPIQPSSCAATPSDQLLALLQPQMIRALQWAQQAMSSPDPVDRNAGQIADWYDGHFLHHLIQLHCTNGPGQPAQADVPAPVLQDWQAARHALKHLLESAGQCVPLLASNDETPDIRPLGCPPAQFLECLHSSKHQLHQQASSDADLSSDTAEQTQGPSRSSTAAFDSTTPPGLPPATPRRLPDFAMDVYRLCGVSEPGSADGVMRAPARVAGGQPIFYISGPYQERYHWHVKLELESAFWTEASDNEERLLEWKKQVMLMPLDELLSARGIKARAKHAIQGLLESVNRNPHLQPEERQALQRQARDLALKAVEASINRQTQMEQGAMARMVASLEGCQFYAAAGSTTTRQASAGITSSGKAAQIRENNLQRKQAEALQEEVEMWAGVQKSLVRWSEEQAARDAESSSTPSCLPAIDTFLGGCSCPEVLQVALTTKILVLYYVLLQRSKATARRQQQSSSSAPSTNTDPTSNTLTVQLLQALQQLCKMDPQALLKPALPTSQTCVATEAAKGKGKSGDGKAPKAEKGQKSQQEPEAWLVALPWKTKRSAPALSTAAAVLQALGFASMAAELVSQVCQRGLAATTGLASGSVSKGKEKSSGKSKGSKPSQGSSSAAPEVGTSNTSLGTASSPVQEACAAVTAAAAGLKLAAVPGEAGCSAVRFQLTHMGHLLERPGGGPRDSRVSGFIPDAWQRQLLDIVDAGSSAVVSAPTSSGKTFISSYVIEKILKQPHGVVVIVLPTKALVNQVAAQVYKDFGKSYEGILYGIFTRDFRTNVMKSRVLITVPACLEILLLSPNNRAWVQSLEFAIFDEVHCINEHGGGDTWERLLLAMRCPLLALSATIGNPMQFSSWLQRVKDLQRQQDIGYGSERPAAAYHVQLITHNQRYNDLQHHVYVPPLGISPSPSHDLQDQQSQREQGPRRAAFPKPPALPVWPQQKGGPGSAKAASSSTSQASSAADCLGQVLELHPLASMLVDEVGSSGNLPKDLSCTPHEVLALYDCMVAEAQQLTAQSRQQGADGLPRKVSGDGPLTDIHGSGAAADGDTACSVSAAGKGLVDSCHARDAMMLEALHALDPDIYFGASGTQLDGTSSTSRVLVSRPDVKAWEHLLLQQVVAWCRAGPRWKAAMEAVQHQLCGAAQQALAAAEQAWRSAFPHESCHGREHQRTHFMQLLLTLSQRGMLPAIVFHHDRGGCEAYAMQLVKSLGLAQEEYRQMYAPQLKALYKKYENSIAMRQALQEQQEAQKGKGKGNREEDGGPQQATLPPESSPIATVAGLTFSLLPDEPDPSFTFLHPSKMRSQPLMETIQDLQSAWEYGSGMSEAKRELLAAMRLGIGVHHSGLDKKYRQAVEMLFRSKTLQVVVATGTLAYGIHMPCRTVVMAGDSIFLDALNFKQMSGRAGRRGLDPLGHVVFYSLPVHKVHRLRTAPLPRLRGQFLLTPTLTLRLMMLSQQLKEQGSKAGTGVKATSQKAKHLARMLPMWNATGAAEDMMGCIVQEPFLRALLSPVLAMEAEEGDSAGAAATGSGGTAADKLLAGQGQCWGQDQVQQQLLHTFTMSLHHLAEQHLLDHTGQVSGLAGLAAHLFWTEPANFVLVRLLSSGALHDLVASYQSDQSWLEALMLVVAHLFLRQPLHPSTALQLRSRAKGTSSSVVVLPPLPPVVGKVVQQYNQQVFSTTMRCILDYASGQAAKEVEDGAEVTLPLSGISCGMAGAGAGDPAVRGEAPCKASRSPRGLWHMLTSKTVDSTACSPFMALTGFGDSFESVPELLGSLKQSIHLSAASIPVLQLMDRHGQVCPLNAWAWDFYKHGDLTALVKANQIREGDAWEALRTMQGVLQATALSLETAAEQQDGSDAGLDTVVHGFRQIADEFGTRFSRYIR